MPGRHHFSVMDGLADQKSALFAGARRPDEARPMNEYLSTARYVDSADPGVLAFSEKNAKGSSERARGFAVLRSARPDPLQPVPRLLRSRSVPRLGRAQGQRGLLRRQGVAARRVRAPRASRRVGFADVKNHPHHAAPGRDHGQRSVRLSRLHRPAHRRQVGEGHAGFNLALCARFRVKPLEFDGRADSIFHPFDEDERRHMEYLRDRGVYADVPVDEIQSAFREAIRSSTAWARTWRRKRSAERSSRRASRPRSPRPTR